MKILVLGATGPTDRHVVDLSLKARDLATALRGQDGVISAPGTGKSARAAELFSCAAALIDTAKQEEVSRLVWMSSFDVGETFSLASLPQKLLFRTAVREICGQGKGRRGYSCKWPGLDAGLSQRSHRRCGQMHVPCGRADQNERPSEHQPIACRRIHAQGGAQPRLEPSERGGHRLATGRRVRS